MGARWVSLVTVVTACASAPDNPVARAPLLAVDQATARVSTNAGAPMQFAIEFAGAGVRMPQAILLDGTNRVGTGSCPTESGVGIGVYPALNAVAPVHGGPTATGSLEIVWGGPVIAKIQTTWATSYSCPGDQQANGTSTFTIFPNGRIVRDDVAKPSTTTLSGGTACGCSSDNRFYFTSFWTLVQGAQDVNPDGTAAVDGMPSGCAVYPNHMIGFAWPDGSTRITTPNGLSAHVHDWAADALTLPPDERQLTSAIMLSEETVPANCAQVLAELDDFPIMVSGTMVFTDNAGIYVDSRSHVDPVEITGPRRLPKGFAITLDVGDFAELSRSPELDGDWYFVQPDGDRTVFWFPDGLDVGQSITIDLAMTDTPDTIPSGSGDVGSPEAYCPACGQSFSPDLELCPNDRARLVRLVDKADPLIGRVFERRYEIRSRLGEGGMGAVYRGWQLSVDREVAIKVIDPKLSSNRGVVKRFLREARLSSRLGQPSIVNVYDFGQTEDGILYIVMELLRGHTLARELEARRAFSLERTIGIAIQLCDALAAAHSQGIIHRDLKPGNVVILDDPPGRDLVKVLDFGLAKSLISDAMSKVTHTDAMLGTPLYMSPEQIEGHASDQRADLYALGCILHEMVSGAPPFSAATVNGVLSKHLYEMAAPLPADLPPSLADLIMRLIARHPDERPQTAAEVRSALLRELGHTSVLGARVLAERPSAARPPAAGGFAVAHPTTSPSIGTSAVARSGRRWLIGLVALMALGALVTAIAIGLSRNRGSTAPTAQLPDASRAPSNDAAVDAGVVVAPANDAAKLRPRVDAGVASSSSLDAAKVRPRADAATPAARVDAGRVTRPDRAPVDAASELDFYKPDATP